MPIADAAMDGAVAEIKAWLRLSATQEDEMVAQIARAAVGHGEGFLGQALIRRSVTERLPVCAAWTRLRHAPVVAIDAVRGLPADGASFALPVGSYAVDIDGRGDGWVRVSAPGAAGRIEVTYTAGLAQGWSDLPDAIRQGAVRLAAHMFHHRDTPGDPPPAAVAALWRPWRRMRLA